MDCVAEPGIGQRFAPTRWLAMTRTAAPRPGHEGCHFPTHFGGRFSENAFGPSM
jgi:hypothetical protein